MEESRSQLFLKGNLKARRTRNIVTYWRLPESQGKITCVDRLIGQHIQIGLDLLILERQHFERHPWMRRLHSNQHRCPVSLKLAACPGSSSIVLRRHENRASLCVTKQMGTRLITQKETIIGRPVQHLLTTASDNRDIQCFNLHLLQHLCLVSHSRSSSKRKMS